MTDKREILLREKPFGYVLLKGEKCRISFRGKVVSTIVGKDYARLLKVIGKNDEFEMQLFLAKITGHFKHGNE